MTVKLTRRDFLELTAVSGAGLLLPSVAFSDVDWPKRAITGVNGASAGGGSDYVSRAIAIPMGAALGKRVNIINKPGAAHSIATDYVWKKPSDGYWWVMTSNYNRFLRPMKYHHTIPWKDWQYFRAVSTIMSFAVLPESPIKNFGDFLDMAKKKPGKVTIGNSGHGGVWHLGMALVEKVAGIKVHHVPYKGDKTALLGLFQKEIDVVGIEHSPLHPLAKEGKVRHLAVFMDEPLKIGDSEYEPITKYLPAAKKYCTYGGGLSPAVKRDTDTAILKKIETAFLKAQDDPGYKEKLASRGILQTPFTGKEADRLAALWEVVTAWQFYELGVGKVHPQKDLKLPRLEAFDEWWPPKEYEAKL